MQFAAYFARNYLALHCDRALLAARFPGTVFILPHLTSLIAILYKFVPLSLA